MHAESIKSRSRTIFTAAAFDVPCRFVRMQLANKLDPEGRYFFLNAVANQLRYPNQHTHYFSCVLLYLFAEAQSEMVQEQITRVLLERLIVHRPHPVRFQHLLLKSAAFVLGLEVHLRRLPPS